LHPAVGRIGEVDAAVALDDDVVGAVELLALVVARQRRAAAVRLGARHPARGVLADDQPALAVPGEPVRLEARLAEGRDALPLAPAAQVIPRHVAEKKVALAPMP